MVHGWITFSRPDQTTSMDHGEWGWAIVGAALGGAWPVYLYISSSHKVDMSTPADQNDDPKAE
jgi:hypothetical protein